MDEWWMHRLIVCTNCTIDYTIHSWAFNISDRCFLFDIANITELCYCIQKWFINERVLLNMQRKLSVNDSPKFSVKIEESMQTNTHIPYDLWFGVPISCLLNLLCCGLTPEPSSRSHLRDCEIFANLRLKL